MRPNNQGLYNIVSADVSGSPAQSGSPQLIGQKRGFVGEEENDEYNNVNNSNQPSPPLAMHPPPPLSSIAVTAAVNAATAGTFPSPMNSNSSPNNSAFSGWGHSGKRVKYEFPEATTPSSSTSSPRSNTTGYQLPGLGAGSATPGAAPSTPQGYPHSNLQMVTNAQQNTVLHTPSPDGTPVEESNSIGGRRYDQYRQREDQASTEEISNGGGWD
ncbi:1117_t:CDS:2 [Cetraspora pellucida]|uniref:1117_t:CDS:1 n=1 Tax=Cetraspora pellucida TaxID=1433469 RepID=A0ACA9JYF0_9GLOM|nr:1117_t:CDS:2 [Cetraspora pellucida]